MEKPQRNNLQILCFVIPAFLLVSCGDPLEEQIALLEKYGISQRDCGSSSWFRENRPELFLAGGAAEWLALKSPQANSECIASWRLVEQVREADGLFRRYRCKVQGGDVEMSLSATRSERGMFDACEFAHSGASSFDDSQRYTQFRDDS